MIFIDFRRGRKLINSLQSSFWDCKFVGEKKTKKSYRWKVPLQLINP